MSDPLESLIDVGALSTSPFPENSRYHGVATRIYRTPSGEQVVYLSRRFVPDSAQLAATGSHTVLQGDRLDLIAARYLADPLLFWRFADANGAFAPEDLTEEPGRRLTIALPEGFGGGGA
jgi:hypothetical protein